MSGFYDCLETLVEYYVISNCSLNLFPRYTIKWTGREINLVLFKLGSPTLIKKPTT